MENEYVYKYVARLVAQYPYGVGRSTIAAVLGVSKTTAQGHLEKCVRLGLLRKFYGWLSRSSRGWVYISPDAAPDVAAFDSDPLVNWDDESYQDAVISWERQNNRASVIDTSHGVD